mmetsp:Transcript_16875/g.20311  ORF Transcript_16875/g.20311 Transcript_16875/m.20311 type:complete len:242 (-) Transcript_16875:1925-2650(-)
MSFQRSMLASAADSDPCVTNAALGSPMHSNSCFAASVLSSRLPASEPLSVPPIATPPTLLGDAPASELNTPPVLDTEPGAPSSLSLLDILSLWSVSEASLIFLLDPPDVSESLRGLPSGLRAGASCNIWMSAPAATSTVPPFALAAIAAASPPPNILSDPGAPRLGVGALADLDASSSPSSANGSMSMSSAPGGASSPSSLGGGTRTLNVRRRGPCISDGLFFLFPDSCIVPSPPNPGCRL